jgi:transcriptional regulator with XRE-family HTH domain
VARKSSPAPETGRDDKVRKARAKNAAALLQTPGPLDFAAKLALTMEARGMTQPKLERAILALSKQGLVLSTFHQSRISKWLGRTGSPNHVQTHALAVALEVPLAYLADPTRTERPDIPSLRKEMFLGDLISMVGIDAALERVSLKAKVAVHSITAGEGETTYGDELARRPRLADERKA